MGFGECAFTQKSALNLVARQLCVTLDEDVSHFHLLFLVDDNIEYNLIFVAHIVALAHLDVGILKAFVIEVSLSQDFSAVYHVGGYLCPFKQTQLVLHVFALRLFQSYVVDNRYARAHGQAYVQVNLVANDRVGRNHNVRE